MTALERTVMSPSAIQAKTRATATAQDQRPNVFLYGIGVEYPPHSIKPDDLDVLARRFYPSSPALEKVLTINAYTGIDSRSSIGTIDHSLVNAALPPSINDLNTIFMTHGVALSVAACRQALAQSRTALSQITHVVSTTCTNSANPGYDHFVVKELGLDQSVPKVLLHGVGCSGGMAAMRTAAGLVMGESFRGRRARVLVLACEISTTLVRSELDSVSQDQEVRIGVCLFSDCASAIVLGNDVEEGEEEEDDVDVDVDCVRGEPLMELLGWEHKIIPDTEPDLGFDVHPLGWKVVLSPHVPRLTSSALPKLFTRLVSSVPELVSTQTLSAHQFYWALHPGGATILSGVEKTMGLTPEHMRASYEVYMGHGNSSSATFFSVLKRMLEVDGDTHGDKDKEYVMGCAFGPGIAIEMAVLKRLDLGSDRKHRRKRQGERKVGDGDMNGMLNGNGSDGSSEVGESGSGIATPVEVLIAEAEEVD